MSALDDLYQATILEHDRAPRNYGCLAHPTHRAEGYNPLCGDRVRVTLTVKDERLAELTFEADGCAISRASASLMTEHLRGQKLSEIEPAIRAFEAMLRSGAAAPALSELGALQGIRRFPSRMRCATLAWLSVLDALAADRTK